MKVYWPICRQLVYSYVYLLLMPACLSCVCVRACVRAIYFIVCSVCMFKCVLISLYPPSERSERGIYCDACCRSVVLSFRAHAVFRCKYLENGLSDTN